MIRRLAGWWVAVWDRSEPPTVLATIRIGIAVVLLTDFATTWRLGLVTSLLTSARAGGLAANPDAHPPLWFRWVGDGPDAANLLFGLLVAATVALGLGLFTRTSAVAVMLLTAQWSQILPESDRAIDLLLRDVLAILAFSSAGATASIDARWTTGRWTGDGAPAPAWPRYLIVLQIVVMYFTAGVQKYAQHWWPWGGFTALYVILNDWSYARTPGGWLRNQPFYLGTQLSTAVTMLWQWTYPVVLTHYFPWGGDERASDPGRFRRWFARYRLHWVWIAIGMWFHVAIASTMELGIFPWGMMAVYPAFLHPDELRAVATRVGSFVRNRARSRRTSAG
ncbi:MAG: HTTM domain-containing protein [Myxococcota bacterium]